MPRRASPLTRPTLRRPRSRPTTRSPSRFKRCGPRLPVFLPPSSVDLMTLLFIALVSPTRKTNVAPAGNAVDFLHRIMMDFSLYMAHCVRFLATACSDQHLNTGRLTPTPWHPALTLQLQIDTVRRRLSPTLPPRDAGRLLQHIPHTMGLHGHAST